MEKNILPIAVNNARPNPDLSLYNGKDTYFHNMFFEVYNDAQTDTQKVFAIKRPGIAAVAATTSPIGHAGGYGCFTGQNYAGNHVYYLKVGPSFFTLYHFDGTTVTVCGLVNGGLTAKNTRISNVGLPDDTVNIAVTATDGVSYFKNATAVGGTSASTGAPWTGFVTSAVYLNNRVFIGDVSIGEIFQSGLGTYSTFSASEFISVEAYGGQLVEIARYNNYIAAFKEYSMEFFEDVANPNGTVLARVGQAIQQVGCTNPRTIVDTGNGQLIWVSNDESKHKSVMMLTNSFQVQDVADPIVKKYLNLMTDYGASYSHFLNVNGNQFYILHITTGGVNDPANITFAYDLKSKIWTPWYTTGNGTTFTLNGLTYSTLGLWNVSGSCVNAAGTTYVQDSVTGELYQLDDSIFQDKGQPINYQMQFAKLDFGNNKRKFLNKYTILTDQAEASGTATFTVGWYHNDKASGATRTVVASPTSDYELTAYALGSFKRGTINIQSTDNYPIRVSAVVFDVDVGEGYAIS